MLQLLLWDQKNLGGPDIYAYHFVVKIAYYMFPNVSQIPRISWDLLGFPGIS